MSLIDAPKSTDGINILGHKLPVSLLAVGATLLVGLLLIRHNNTAAAAGAAGTAAPGYDPNAASNASLSAEVATLQNDLQALTSLPSSSPTVSVGSAPGVTPSAPAPAPAPAPTPSPVAPAHIDLGHSGVPLHAIATRAASTSPAAPRLALPTAAPAPAAFSPVPGLAGLAFNGIRPVRYPNTAEGPAIRNTPRPRPVVVRNEHTGFLEQRYHVSSAASGRGPRSF